MQLNTDPLVADHPVASTVLVAAVATLVYAGLQIVLDGAVATVETAIFVLVFTAVYVGGTWFLRTRRDVEGAGAAIADPDTADAESVDAATTDAESVDADTTDAESADADTADAEGAVADTADPDTSDGPARDAPETTE